MTRVRTLMDGFSLSLRQIPILVMNKRVFWSPPALSLKARSEHFLTPDSERQVPRARIPVMSTGLGVPELFRHATTIGAFSFPFVRASYYLGINCNKTPGFLALSRSLYCETHLLFHLIHLIRCGTPIFFTPS
jgi:hypothetical protein